jgi:hypothetical protein
MTSKSIRAGALAAFAGAVLAFGAPAHAGSVLETATAVPGGSGDYPVYGDGINADSNYVGATFALTASGVSVLQVGANLDAYGTVSGGVTGDGGNDEVFAEIVSVASLASLPAVPGTPGTSISDWLQANDLGHAILTVPATAGDASTLINFSNALAPGNYALIIGSGLYGATGGVNLTSGNATLGSPNVFASTTGDTFAAYTYDTGIRLFAATPVPLPAGLPLLGSGLATLVGLFRRRRVVVAAAAV